ncbi:hypothetical protein [Rhizobium sp. C4]|uniref:hypothetical protein n=1 Tax=Rhizobium sp. C4 TaxID=1349800 RepID=UPI001E590B15|nr:hypothetical protein [Rhizobium sp. C4]MCD2176108.1 hypothetical protein [Rhizobium sp. C4]
MKQVYIEIREDDTLYFGHALITFDFVGADSGPIQLVVSRKSGEKPYLGLTEWQASPAALDATVVSRENGKTVVRAGPNICDKLPYDLQVRFQIVGTEVYGQAFWPSIQPVPGGYSGHLDTHVAEQPPAAPPAPPPAQPARPSPPSPPPPTPFPQTKTQSKVASGPAPTLKSKGASSRGLPLILIIAVIACVGAVYVYREPIQKFLQERRSREVQATLIDRFEALRRADPTGAQLLALSHDAFAARDGAIGFQAITLSAQRGNQEAKLEMARWYDPRTFNESRATDMDANRAGRAYFELALSGNADAKGLLRSLCQASRSGGPNYRGFLASTYCQGNLGP